MIVPLQKSAMPSPGFGQTLLCSVSLIELHSQHMLSVPACISAILNSCREVLLLLGFPPDPEGA